MGAADSHGDVEPEVDVAGGVAAGDSPVVEVDVVHDRGDVIARDAERAESIHDRGVQLALRVERAAREAVDRDDGPVLGVGEVRRAGEAMRLVDDQPDVAVVGGIRNASTRASSTASMMAVSSSTVYWRRTSISAAGMAPLWMPGGGGASRGCGCGCAPELVRRPSVHTSWIHHGSSCGRCAIRGCCGRGVIVRARGGAVHSRSDDDRRDVSRAATP